jgi:hypothetical protein
MSERTSFALIVPENFIQATRDSGYKSLGSALAELVDNAFEAKATQVSVTMEKVEQQGGAEDVLVTVADNGRGMEAQTLRHALQFGWSSRFNQRDSHGRYGMGLPNASLSHARRVDVWSSPDARTAAASYLDVDEVVTRAASIPPASQVPMPDFRRLCPFARGTLVAWTRCDRLMDRKLGPLSRKLRAELGRLFRYQLWAGKRLQLNGELVASFDPLFVKEGANLVGAKPFGPELTYETEAPSVSPRRTSVINVRFTELPVGQWHSLSNSEKNAQGIAKNAGVSIVRAGREIDRGWFFMGQKRKENYDDWWRCEVRFEPELDELFGVTHTKQEIHPSEKLLSILVPDMERIARELNGRARRAFIEVKGDSAFRESETLAERHDSLLEPPREAAAVGKNGARRIQRGGRGRVGGLEYRLKFQRLDSPCFYQPELDGTRLTVVLNEAHPLVRASFGADGKLRDEMKKSRRDIELLILAAARAELTVAKNTQAKTWTSAFRQSWSRTLATFLS